MEQLCLALTPSMRTCAAGRLLTFMNCLQIINLKEEREGRKEGRKEGRWSEWADHHSID